MDIDFEYSTLAQEREYSAYSEYQNMTREEAENCVCYNEEDELPW